MNQSEGRRCRLGLQEKKDSLSILISPDVSLRFTSLFSSPSHKPLARLPPLSRDFFLSFFFSFFCPPALLSFSFFFTPFPSTPPLLFAHVFRMLLRAVATARRTQLPIRSAQKTWNGRNLQLGNLNHPLRSLRWRQLPYFILPMDEGIKGITLRWIMK